jgi:hypothetical protein
MFRVVMCQIRKCCTSAEIHLVDVEMLSFDLGPCTAFARKVLEKANAHPWRHESIGHGHERNNPAFRAMILAGKLPISQPLQNAGSYWE